MKRNKILLQNLAFYSYFDIFIDFSNSIYFKDIYFNDLLDYIGPISEYIDRMLKQVSLPGQGPNTTLHLSFSYHVNKIQCCVVFIRL